MARRKKKKLPDIRHLIEVLKEEFDIQVFPLREIPRAVAWAERGNIAVHENYHSRRKQSYHVISGNRENLERFCHRIGVDPKDITASEFFRFWHLTWFPQPSEERVAAEEVKPQGLTYIHPCR